MKRIISLRDKGGYNLARVYKIINAKIMQIEDEKFTDDYLMLFMNDSDEEILNGIIKSCLLLDPKIFFPFLKSESLQTGMPNNIIFYRHYKFMIECLRCNSSKNLHYKWGRRDWLDDISYLALEIFDDIHLHPRLNIIIDKIDDKLYIEKMPF